MIGLQPERFRPHSPALPGNGPDRPAPELRLSHISALPGCSAQRRGETGQRLFGTVQRAKRRAFQIERIGGSGIELQRRFRRRQRLAAPPLQMTKHRQHVPGAKISRLGGGGLPAQTFRLRQIAALVGLHGLFQELVGGLGHGRTRMTLRARSANRLCLLDRALAMTMK